MPFPGYETLQNFATVPGRRTRAAGLANITGNDAPPLSRPAGIAQRVPGEPPPIPNPPGPVTPPAVAQSYFNDIAPGNITQRVPGEPPPTPNSWAPVPLNGEPPLTPNPGALAAPVNPYINTNTGPQFSSPWANAGVDPTPLPSGEGTSPYGRIFPPGFDANFIAGLFGPGAPGGGGGAAPAPGGPFAGNQTPANRAANPPQFNTNYGNWRGPGPNPFAAPGDPFAGNQTPANRAANPPQFNTNYGNWRGPGPNPFAVAPGGPFAAPEWAKMMAFLRALGGGNPVDDFPPPGPEGFNIPSTFAGIPGGF